MTDPTQHTSTSIIPEHWSIHQEAPLDQQPTSTTVNDVTLSQTAQTPLNFFFCLRSFLHITPKPFTSHNTMSHNITITMQRTRRPHSSYSTMSTSTKRTSGSTSSKAYNAKHPIPIGTCVWITGPAHKGGAKEVVPAGAPAGSDTFVEESGVVTRIGTNALGGWYEIDCGPLLAYRRRGTMQVITDAVEAENLRLDVQQKQALPANQARKERQRQHERDRDRVRALCKKKGLSPPEKLRGGHRSAKKKVGRKSAAASVSSVATVKIPIPKPRKLLVSATIPKFTSVAPPATIVHPQAAPSSKPRTPFHPRTHIHVSDASTVAATQVVEEEEIDEEDDESALTDYSDEGGVNLDDLNSSDEETEFRSAVPVIAPVARKSALTMSVKSPPLHMKPVLAVRIDGGSTISTATSRKRPHDQVSSSKTEKSKSHHSKKQAISPEKAALSSSNAILALCSIATTAADSTSPKRDIVRSIPVGRPVFASTVSQASDGTSGSTLPSLPDLSRSSSAAAAATSTGNSPTSTCLSILTTSRVNANGLSPLENWRSLNPSTQTSPATTIPTPPVVGQANGYLLPSAAGFASPSNRTPVSSTSVSPSSTVSAQFQQNLRAQIQHQELQLHHIHQQQQIIQVQQQLHQQQQQLQQAQFNYQQSKINYSQSSSSATSSATSYPVQPTIYRPTPTVASYNSYASSTSAPRPTSYVQPYPPSHPLHSSSTASNHVPVNCMISPPPQPTHYIPQQVAQPLLSQPTDYHQPSTKSYSQYTLQNGSFQPTTYQHQQQPSYQQLIC